MQHGAEGLADYEILEMLLFAARPRGDVKPLAKSLLKKFGSLNKVVSAEKAELEKVPGCGSSAIAVLKVAKNMAERLVRDEVKRQPVLDSWLALIDYCKMALKDSKIEEFRLLHLNGRNMLIKDEILQKGTINQTQAYPREVVKHALDSGSSAIILLHNHPSGDANPSKADIDTTRQIVAGAESLGIKVHDHIIIAGNNFYSFKASGLL